LLFAALVSCISVADDRLTIAVASNFLATAEEIAAVFTADTGTPVRLSSGSTGKLYAQIINGAPYDIFLAADTARPRLLEERGIATPGSLITYAEGRLVLVSADPDLRGRNCLWALQSGSYRKLAIANPETAPYGAAAKAYLQTAGLWDDTKSRLVMGENILQTLQFVATGNATLGLVAASQLASPGNPVDLVCRWAIDVPEAKAIRQGGVVLRRSDKQEAAQSFMNFMQGAKARKLMLQRGYEVSAN